MKKYFAYAMTALVACFAASCSEDEEPTGYVGTNGVTLTVQGGNTLIENEDGSVNVTVALDRAYDVDVKLSVEVQGTEPERLTVTPNPVTITAGNKTATFEVTSTKLGNLTGPLQYTLTMGSLQADMEMVQTVFVNLRPATDADTELTEEQQALVESWKANYGIDVTRWLGKVTLNGDVTEPGEGTTTYFSEQRTTPLSGTTIFTLGEGCTEDKIVLDMVDNPMGMTAFFYNWLRQNTVDDDEYFNHVDYDVPEEDRPVKIADLIGWSKTSQETFNVTLKGLVIDLTEENDNGNTIQFVEEGESYVLDADGNPIEIDGETYTYSAASWIPFEFKFSAWDRLLQLIAQGDEMAIEGFNIDYTSDPYYYLRYSGITEDEWDAEENNFYVEPAGSIDFNAGKMTFAFPADHMYAGGYARVNVTYTAN
ncbi:MAG: DUF4929 domain-containing protein [Clostridium sp.]|nr:DUF4929 domain-containing protein [Clostridium sp.]